MSDALVTPAQITSALAGDNGPAIDTLLAALSPLFRQLAGRHAATNNAGSASDLEQDARIAAWQGLGRFDAERFTDETLADGFQGFIYSSVDHALRDAVREARFGNCGSGMREAVKVFGQMLNRAEGDAHLAEQMCRHVPTYNHRLSTETARAARIAWSGEERLDAAIGEDGTTLVEALAEELEVPEDMVTADDISREQRRVRIATVRAVLDSMGAGQTNTLRHDYGIGGVPEFDNDADMAEALGTTPSALAKARNNGKRTFSTKYITASGLGADWADAAASQIKSRNSKSMG